MPRKTTRTTCKCCPCKPLRSSLFPPYLHRVQRRLACTIQQFYKAKNRTPFNTFRHGQIAVIVMNRTEVLIKYINSTEHTKALPRMKHPTAYVPRDSVRRPRRCFARCNPLLLSSRPPENVLYQRRDGGPAKGNFKVI